MTRRPITAREQLVLDNVRDFIARHSYPPTMRDLCDLLGFASTNGVACHLESLERKGAIRRARGVSRGIVVVDRGRA